jgi:ABC-type dipeptide/oligopeptide/nickel transport system permease subunit
LSWANWSGSRYQLLARLVAVLLGGVAGTYLGLFFGPGVEQSHWWSRFATDISIYFTGAALSTGVATVLGVIEMRQARSRLEATARPLRR